MSYYLFLEILKNAHKTSNSDEIYEAVTKVFSDMFTWLPFEKYLTSDLFIVLMPLGEKEVPRSVPILYMVIVNNVTINPIQWLQT